MNGVIVSEKANIDRIIATLGLKEMTQGTLIRKLCTYTAPNPTRRPSEFDKLVQHHTLRYLRTPIERNVHRSQNRIIIPSATFKHCAGGSKELTGRPTLRSMQPVRRLIANAVIYYNSAILSRLPTK
uniref:Tn3 family transposase n=1 Tax=Escherichia coli TaxID=562 RepID=UPI001BCD628A|nr:Tn3 family transposase [Escherichia coli]